MGSSRPSHRAGRRHFHRRRDRSGSNVGRPTRRPLDRPGVGDRDRVPEPRHHLRPGQRPRRGRSRHSLDVPRSSDDRAPACRYRAVAAGYLLIAYAWALAYQLVALSDPSSFSFPATAVPQTLRFRLLYFSVTTLTTAGYGDITPLAPVARCLAALEGVIGQLFPVLLLARLVSMELLVRNPAPTVRRRGDCFM